MDPRRPVATVLLPVKRPQSLRTLNLCLQVAESLCIRDNARIADSRTQAPPGEHLPGEAEMSNTVDPSHEHQLIFTSSQAARYLGVSLATIRRWTDAGYLSGYRTPGGQRRFSRAQLDGFVESLHRTDETTPKRQGRNVA
jgi:excisionase family DNA binding protein